jgi:hypothetical protein
MRRGLVSIGIALALATALPTLASAQRGHGGGGGVAAHGGGGAAIGGGGGGAARIGGGGGAGFARSAAPSAGFAAVPNAGPRIVQGGNTMGGQRFVRGNVQPNVQANVQPGGNWAGRGQWQGRRHFRGGPGFAVYGAAPYDDYGYGADYAYTDDCYQLRLIRGAWRQVNVCGDQY